MTTEIKIEILERLQSRHRGREHAIRRADLARAFDLDERTLRAMISELVEVDGHPIARTNDGIFLAVTDEEREENCRRYMAMARANFRQATAFDRAAARREAQQIGLFGGAA